MTKIDCEHYWCYVDAVYSHGHDENASVIRRYCSKCDQEQYAVAKNWRAVPVGMFDHFARKGK